MFSAAWRILSEVALTAAEPASANGKITGGTKK
jgi:hypothetical protein